MFLITISENANGLDRKRFGPYFSVLKSIFDQVRLPWEVKLDHLLNLEAPQQPKHRYRFQTAQGIGENNGHIEPQGALG